MEKDNCKVDPPSCKLACDPNNNIIVCYIMLSLPENIVDLLQKNNSSAIEGGPSCMGENKYGVALYIYCWKIRDSIE